MKRLFTVTLALSGVTSALQLTQEDEEVVVNTAQIGSVGKFSSAVKEGQSMYVNCPYYAARSGSNRRSKGVIMGVQSATADDKTDDKTTFYFDFDRLDLKDNELTLRLYNGEMLRTCELPDPAPTYLAEITATNTDQSKRVITAEDVTFSLFDNRAKIEGGLKRDQIVWHFQAKDKKDAFQNIGCCRLEPVNEEAVAWRYNRAFGPAGVKAVFGISRLISPEFKDLIAPAGPDLGPKIPDIYTEFTDTLEKTVTEVDTTLNSATIPWLYENYYFNPYQHPMISSYTLLEIPEEGDVGLCVGIEEVIEKNGILTLSWRDPALERSVQFDTIEDEAITYWSEYKGYIQQIFVSSDTVDDSVIALKVSFAKTDAEELEEVACGNYDEATGVGLVDNLDSQVLVTGLITKEGTGAILSITVSAIPLLTTITPEQYNFWKERVDLVEPPTASETINLSTDAEGDIVPVFIGVEQNNPIRTAFPDLYFSKSTYMAAERAIDREYGVWWQYLSRLTQGPLPAVSSLVAYQLEGVCTGIRMTYKNRLGTFALGHLDVSSADVLQFGDGSSVDYYIKDIQVSRDAAADENTYLAMKIINSLDEEILCGTFDVDNAESIKPVGVSNAYFSTLGAALLGGDITKFLVLTAYVANVDAIEDADERTYLHLP